MAACCVRCASSAGYLSWDRRLCDACADQWYEYMSTNIPNNSRLTVITRTPYFIEWLNGVTNTNDKPDGWF